MQFATVGPTLENIRDGKLRALATTGKKRVSSLPDVPTMMEAGVKDYVFALWLSCVVPAGTPDAIVGKLNRAQAEILKDNEIVENLQKQVFFFFFSQPDPANTHILTETDPFRT